VDKLRAETGMRSEELCERTEDLANWLMSDMERLNGCGREAAVDQ
jgi:hypothetical protein